MDYYEEALAELVRADPLTRARKVGDVLARQQDFTNELSRIRREALQDLIAEGATQGELGKKLGMSRARIGQLLTSGPQPERALLGTGALHFAIGGKWESGRTNPSAVISAEALAAYNVLSKLAGDYRMTTEYEIVPPPGIVSLNRANLVVLCSPRLLPLVGQMLESDPNLGFGNGSRGWFLKDHNQDQVYRSPSDAGEHADYAYVGRLPRPDGKGTFLYLAGIHAMGTLGAAHYLAANIEEIYQQVKTKRWSALISCAYDGDSREINEVKAISPIYVADK
ncbi:hypothetical protein [Amycolatopsis keratiniphila]|uniref:Uncharacterized protein n=1 Tax=Amycolatopsis keratiniphila TaxID=129921 RepID=W6IBA4_9PSEU|nr:hypothetical protein [Amycolatopsis keratiniphila]AHJ58541.1 hypothetical protein AORI_P026 [Amycolatopsis keratiniphila]